MPNEYFDWPSRAASDRFVRFDVVRSADMNDALDDLSNGLAKLPTPAQLWSQRQNYATATGAANAWSASIAATYLTALVDGMQVRVKFPASNTNTTPTLNLNGLGAKNIVAYNMADIAAGFIEADIVETLVYNSTTDKWHLMKSPDSSDASGVAYDGSTVEAALDDLRVETGAISMSDYDAVRAYAGQAKTIYITGYFVTVAPAGIAGRYTRDDSDTTSADDGGLTLVDALGRRWKRRFDGAAQCAWFEPVTDGVTDTSSQVQAAINAVGLTSAEYFAASDDYRRAKKRLYINDGNYLVGDLTVYQGTTIEWGPKAVFYVKAGATCAMKSVNYQGQTNPNFNVERVQLLRPRIDMGGNGTFGLLMQGVTNSQIYMPEIINVPAGTAVYDDGFASSAYDKCGIALKGIDGACGAYWNEIYMPRIKGITGNGNNGIWMGTSSTGLNQRANHNRIIAPYCEALARGVQIMGGSDNYIELPEASLCDIGIAIGLTSGTVPCKRNHIKIPYLENCTVSGMRLTSNAYDTIIDGIGSTSGTATPLDDSGAYTEFKSANSDTYTTGFARFYKGAVRFPATQVADTDPNALDDYEEGDFTAVIEGMTAAGTGTYSVQTGNYTKIGNRVIGTINSTHTAHTGTGFMRFAGLPFTCRSGNHSAPCALYTSGLTLTASNVLQAMVIGNTTRIDLFQYPSGGGSAASVTMDTAATINVNFQYQAA